MNEPEWLMKVRNDAKKIFEDAPIESTQYTTLNINFDEIIRAVPETAKLPAIAKKLTKDKSRIIIVQVNRDIVYVNIPEDLKKKGVVLESIGDAVKNHEHVVRDFILSRITKPEDGRTTAFNLAYFNSGVFFFVPKDTVIDRPVYHIVIVTGSEKIVSQTLVLVGDNSSAVFVEEDYSEKAENAFHSSVVEVYVGSAANVNFVNIQDFGTGVTSITSSKALAERNGKISWAIGRLGAGMNKARRDTILAGEGAEVNDTEVFLGDGMQHFDITSNIRHSVPNTKGNVLVKGVLRDSARSVSQGMIKVDKGAQKTDAFLAEHTMLLDPEARSDAIPGLEIEANDVRCTHSASVAQLDEDHVFYLKSRGLSENESKKLIVLGFLNSVLDKIESTEISSQFRGLIENKWGRKK